MSIIKVENVTKRFKDKIVLDNINFTIEKGEIFGLIGPNGAGKSTLINILTNLIASNNGNVEINNMNYSKSPIEIKSILGLVPQELAIMEHLTPYDNLEYFGALYGLKGKLLKERIADALEMSGLTDVKRKKVKKLSGGMKRRLNISIATLHNPKILILDEPTVGVDPQSRNHIFTFLKNLSKENNTTIIYTSHYMEEVEALCSKIFIIDEGKEVAFGNQDYLKSLVFTQNRLILEIKDICANLVFDLKKCLGVSSIDEYDNKLILNVDSSFSLSNALSCVENSNSTLINLYYDKHSLEDVFLNLTGKSLRD